MRPLNKLADTDATFGALIRTLEDRRQAYAAALLAGGDGGALPGHYRDVKPAVAHETSGKCAYCESKVSDVYVGDVEHILPKDGHPERTLDYANLTYVCWYCNNKKHNTEFTDGLGLLNPYVDDPEAFVRFFGTLLTAVPVDPDLIRAKRTIDTIGLNRTGLIESRERAWHRFELLERAYRAATHPAVRDLAKQEIEAAQQPDEEYSYFAKLYFRAVGVP